MSILTNQEVQQTLIEAEGYLQSVLKEAVVETAPRLHLLSSLISTTRIYSASGNETPGFSGQGLQEVYALAKSVLELRPTQDRDIRIESLKPIASALTLG